VWSARERGTQPDGVTPIRVDRTIAGAGTAPRTSHFETFVRVIDLQHLLTNRRGCGSGAAQCRRKAFIGRHVAASNIQ
jgi:hypothetical protein